MASRPSLLVLDDGELGDLVDMLGELGLEFAHLRGSAIPAQISPPERVVVTTPRRAMLTKDWPRSDPYRIAVVTEDSNTLRAMLRRVGFDLLLRRPIHPVALRLVLLRALYVGEEKRREERVTLGTEVQFRSGFWRRKALLADVSQRGCRLLADKPLSAGSRVTLPLPKELAADGLTLPCKVVRVSDKPDPSGNFEMGLAFENLSKDKLARIRAMLKQVASAAGMEDPRVFGLKGAAAKASAPAETAAAATPAPAAARGPAPKAAPAPTAEAAQASRQRLALSRQKAMAASRPSVAAPSQLAATGAARSGSAGSVSPDDRRRHTRAQFGQQVARLDAEADSVLLGRDLSAGGMRVEYHPNLQVGDLLELAVYASPREEPVVVKARVVQDSGDGLGLAFEGVEPAVASRLEQLVARLPSVESLQHGEAAGLGSVVSRVLSGFRREA